MSNLQEIHKNCHQIFRREFFDLTDEEDKNPQIKILCASFACRIYDKLTEDDGSEDCIGENFNHLIQSVEENWFQCYKPGNDIDYYFFNYFLLLYLFVERVDIIFEVINKDGKGKLFADFHFNNFKTLRKINKWANFIKHPKEFLFTHWPNYYMEGEDVIINNGDVKIDTDFIFKHYFSEGKERPVILENNNKVHVEIPNLENITKEFCREMLLFFDFICQNQVVADFLKKKSTIREYYENDGAESGGNSIVTAHNS